MQATRHAELEARAIDAILADPSLTPPSLLASEAYPRHNALRHRRTLHHVCLRTPSDGYQTRVLRLRERAIRRVRERSRC